MTSCGDDPVPTLRVRVAMSSGLASALKTRVGPRGLSAYVNAAVARQLQRDALQEEPEGNSTGVDSASAETEGNV